MSDNDLIRRGDAMRIMSDGDDIVGPDYPEWFINRYATINAIPAADRIEELGKACTEWAEVSQSNYQRAKAAEAKLAECLERNALLEARLGKAVEALKMMCEEFRGYDLPYGSKAYSQATAALARVKGETK